MKILPTVTALSLSFFSPLLFAASLNLPINIDVIALNGQEIKADNPLDLQVGVNQLAFRYEGTYRQAGSQERFESELIVASFIAEDQDYTLTLPTIRNKREADNFDKQPQLSITGKQGELALKQDVITKSGLQWNRKYIEEIAQYNQSQQVASVTEFAKQAETASAAEAAQPAPAEVMPKINTEVKQVAAATTTTAVTSQTLTSKGATSASSQMQASPASPAATKAEVVTQTVIQPKTIAQDQAEISQMLDYWYSKANDETKAAFKNKINN